MSSTPSTTTRIEVDAPLASAPQLTVLNTHRAGAPRLESGPNHGGPPHHSLWPHDVVVWIRSFARGSVKHAGSLRGARRKRGEVDPKTIGVSSLRPQAHALCNEQRAPRRRRHRRQPRADRAHSDRHDEPTRLTATDCASRPNNNNDEIRGRTDRQTMRRQCADSPRARAACQVSQEGEKRGGSV